MKKLSLALEDLAVETFDTTAFADKRGTVVGLETTAAPCSGGCSQNGTWCGNTCDTTCYADLCDCTYGGPYNTTCDVNLTCGVVGSCQYMTCEGPQDNTYCSA
ncbi:MAG: hypothetical protein JWM27_4549 [Gemmatimonadetes bacterium]|nr:hypothetical protein [Gemmatimonadota bacterium]